MSLVETGDLSAGHARALIPLEDPLLQKAAAEEVIRRNLSVRKTEQLASKMIRDAARAGSSDAAQLPFVDYAAEAAAELEKALGRKVRLVTGRRSGRIELEFYDAEDRERLIRALKSLHLQ